MMGPTGREVEFNNIPFKHPAIGGVYACDVQPGQRYPHSEGHIPEYLERLAREKGCGWKYDWDCESEVQRCSSRCGGIENCPGWCKHCGTPNEEGGTPRCKCKENK